MELWYRQPAGEWAEALPVGNGRMGGMVFGGVLTERIALNEDTYPPLGDLILRFPDLERKDITDYDRVLSFDNAIATTSFTADGVRHERAVFVSALDQALIVHLRASRDGVCGVEIGLESSLRHKVAQKGNQLLMLVRSPGNSAPRHRDEKPILHENAPDNQGMDALVMVRMFAEGGKVTATEDRLRVQGADKVTVALCCRTSVQRFGKSPQAEAPPYREACQRDMKALAEFPYEDIQSRHLADYRPLFHRVRMELAGENLKRLPTDERLRRFAAGEEDNGLFPLLFQYERYLLIASSRPGSQAATRIWQEEAQAPGRGNGTVNMNAGMNYWPAEICNLPEMHLPLFDMVERLQSGPSRQGWWPMGYACLAAHLFERYLFTGDREFLEKRAFPACRAAVRFFLAAYLKDGRPTYLASAMNTAIAAEALQNYLCILETLGLTEEDAPAARALLEELPPPVHLYGLHPGHQITPDQTPAQATACRASLERRGDGGTGRGLSWMGNLWARLGDGNRALKTLRRQLNLRGNHTPFQTGRNSGAASGIAQMFVQVRLNEILLLPALPDAWRGGYVHGLCGANGYLVDVDFEDGRLKTVRLTCRYEGRAPVRVRSGDKSIILDLERGESVTLDGELNCKA